MAAEPVDACISLMLKNWRDLSEKCKPYSLDLLCVDVDVDDIVEAGVIQVLAKRAGAAADNKNAGVQPQAKKVGRKERAERVVVGYPVEVTLHFFG